MGRVVLFSLAFFLGALSILVILLQDNLFLFFTNHSEYIRDFGLLLVGVAALIVSLTQAKTLKQQNQGMVRPLLIADIDIREPDKVVATITNHGNGPAIIKDYALKYQKSLYRNDDMTVYANNFLNKIGATNFQMFYYNTNGAIGKNECKEILNVSFPPDTDLAKKLMLIDENLGLLIKYESLLGHEEKYDTDDHTFIKSP